MCRDNSIWLTYIYMACSHIAGKENLQTDKKSLIDQETA